MRTLDDAMSLFVYHPATPDTAKQHAAVRDAFVNLLPELWDLIPDGPEKTLSLRKLHESLMYASLAVALQAPADTSGTRSVARVLPDDLWKRKDPRASTEVVGIGGGLHCPCSGCGGGAA